MSDAKYIEANGHQAKILAPDGGRKLNLTPNLELLFKIAADEVNNSFDCFEIRAGYLEGPPIHFHDHQDETFHVLDGELTIKIGDELITGKIGDFVLIPKGVVHAYANLKEGSIARAVVNVAPGGFYKYIEEITQYLSTAQPPDQAKVTEISAKHGQIFRGPPLAVSLGLRGGGR
jgi:quercetin dioxygenase-like cupin family protein